ncbi:MAG: hypothetical protein ABI779_23190 [Acidobacteriota bacterium]
MQPIEELIALAEAGQAHIEASYTVTRYHIVRKGVDDRGEPLDYPAIFLLISDEDGSVYDDFSYFTDGDIDVKLRDEDAERLRVVIEQNMQRR